MIDFDIEWEDAPGVRDPVLARTWCSLAIRIDSHVVTRVADRRTKSLRSSIYGSAFPLCHWIVDNFWFLLFEPYRWATPCGSRDLARDPADRPWVQRHSFLAAREGGALPDLTLFRDGSAVLARWHRDGEDAAHSFLRFVQEGQAYLDPEAVRTDLERFVDAVLERLAPLSHPEAAQLRDDWAALRTLTHEERQLCAGAARLGIDAHCDDALPGALPDARP